MPLLIGFNIRNKRRFAGTRTTGMDEGRARPSRRAPARRARKRSPRQPAPG